MIEPLSCAPVAVATLPATFANAPAVMRILAWHKREHVEGFIAIAIDLLDTFDGDADLEPGGDEEPAGDDADASWREWHRRGDEKLAIGGAEFQPSCAMATDDDEDCDPAGMYDEDGVNTISPAEHWMRAFANALATAGPGCQWSDVGEPDLSGEWHGAVTPCARPLSAQ